MKRELALLLKAQPEILDSAGKTRSNRVPSSDNNGSRSHKRVKRTTLDDPVPVNFSVAENEDSKSEITSSKEHFEDQCLSTANTGTGFTEDLNKTGMDTTSRTRSNRVPSSDGSQSRSCRRIKRMTLNDPMPVDCSVDESEAPKSKILTSNELLEDQCLSISNINTNTGLTEDLKKTRMEVEGRCIVLGLASRGSIHLQVNKQLSKNKEKTEANGESKVLVDEHKPLRRFTRSLLNSRKDQEDLHLMENGETSVDEGLPLMKKGKTLVDEVDNLTVAEQVNCNSGYQEEDLDLNLPQTPNKIVEMDYSPINVIDQIPQTIRELLDTGLLEGYPVYYSDGKKGPIIHGLIKGYGILCACGSCKGANVVAPSRFGIHAVDTYQRAAFKICFKNGRSFVDVLNICRTANLDTLLTTIKEAIGPLPEKQMASCGNCKELFSTTIAADVELRCSACMNISSTLQNPGKKSGRRGRGRPPKSASSLKSGTPVLARLQSRSCGTDRPPKSASSLKSGTPVLARLQSRNCGTDRSTDVESTPEPSGRNGKRSKKLVHTPMISEASLVAGSSKKKDGKITTKDFLRNRAVFERLPDGTELSYFAHGERLLSGYKQDSGIFCFCCNSVVSASQFEAHAGYAKHKKPYDNIYTSDGLSLHDLALSIRKENGCLDKKQDSLCSLCGEGDSLLECYGCPRAFHRECAALTCEPSEKWYCRYCESLFAQRKDGRINPNAIAAGWTEGVDPLEKIGELCMRTLKETDDFTFCHLCSGSDFERSVFGPRTILLCDQCEKEFHISCLKEHGLADLNELPHGTWFCGDTCRRIHASLQVLLSKGPLELPSCLLDALSKKYEQEDPIVATDLSWMLLSGQLLQHDSRKAKVKRLFSQAISVLHEGFGSILTHGGGRDLIPPIVYGRDLKSNRDYSGMYCAILLLKDVIISVAVFRVFGRDVMELPLVATRQDYRGKGYFQALFGCIESFLSSHNVKSIVLPAAEDAEGLWLRLGFKKMTPEQYSAYKKVYWKMVEFDGIVMLEKEVQELQPVDVAQLDLKEAVPSEPVLADAEQEATAEEGADRPLRSQLEPQPNDPEIPISNEAVPDLLQSQLEPGISLEFQLAAPEHLQGAAANCPESQLERDSCPKVQPDPSFTGGAAGCLSQTQMATVSSQLNLVPKAEQPPFEEAASGRSPPQMEPESNPTFQPIEVLQLFPDKAMDAPLESQLEPENNQNFHVDTEQHIPGQGVACDLSEPMPEPSQRIQRVLRADMEQTKPENLGLFSISAAGGVE